ncbi:hypothetical protein X946_829 [Burkholderia sp. ABCPW 111]|nr:hypothetical protein X946_829 [Burkholderia sp. ABCPW 111]
MSAAHGLRSHWRSRVVIGALLLGAIAAFVWLPRHRYHVLGWLPYLLLFACPLAHVFMHRGHRRRTASESGARLDSEDGDEHRR